MTASGLQHSFDWRGVAASAAAAGVGYAVGKAANSLMNYAPQANGQGFDWSKQFGHNTVTRIASGAAHGMAMGRPVNATQLIAGSAIGGALGVTAMEDKLLAAQQESPAIDFQKDVANRRASNPLLQMMAERQSREAASLAEAQREFLWSSVAGSGSGGSVHEMATPAGRTNREMEMHRLMEQAQVPQYRRSAPLDLGEIRGVGNIPGKDAPFLSHSATGLQGLMEGLRGEHSVMEIESIPKMFGRYGGMAGELINQMFNPKEIAHGMWTAIDSGNPIEMGMAATGFMPVFGGTIGKATHVFGQTAARADTAVVRSLGAENYALERIAANNRAASPWAELRQAYQQAKGQVDFAHIEADVSFRASGRVDAKGGHFATSPRVEMIAGTESIAENGVIRSKINLLGPDGKFYLKTNNRNFSTLTPADWSLARAKGEMSQAFLNRHEKYPAQWIGESGGIEFKFNPPRKDVQMWRGYPLFEKK